MGKMGIRKLWAMIRRTPHQPDQEVGYYADVDAAVRDATELNTGNRREGDPTYVVTPLDTEEEKARLSWKRR